MSDSIFASVNVKINSMKPEEFRKFVWVELLEKGKASAVRIATVKRFLKPPQDMKCYEVYARSVGYMESRIQKELGPKGKQFGEKVIPFGKYGGFVEMHSDKAKEFKKAGCKVDKHGKVQMFKPMKVKEVPPDGLKNLLNNDWIYQDLRTAIEGYLLYLDENPGEAVCSVIHTDVKKPQSPCRIKELTEQELEWLMTKFPWYNEEDLLPNLVKKFYLKHVVRPQRFYLDGDLRECRYPDSGWLFGETARWYNPVTDDWEPYDTKGFIPMEQLTTHLGDRYASDLHPEVNEYGELTGKKVRSVIFNLTKIKKPNGWYVSRPWAQIWAEEESIDQGICYRRVGSHLEKSFGTKSWTPDQRHAFALKSLNEEHEFAWDVSVVPEESRVLVRVGEYRPTQIGNPDPERPWEDELVVRRMGDGSPMPKSIQLKHAEEDRVLYYSQLTYLPVSFIGKHKGVERIKINKAMAEQLDCPAGMYRRVEDQFGTWYVLLKQNGKEDKQYVDRSSDFKTVKLERKSYKQQGYVPAKGEKKGPLVVVNGAKIHKELPGEIKEVTRYRNVYEMVECEPSDETAKVQAYQSVFDLIELIGSAEYDMDRKDAFHLLQERCKKAVRIVDAMEGFTDKEKLFLKKEVAVAYQERKEKLLEIMRIKKLLKPTQHRNRRTKSSVEGE